MCVAGGWRRAVRRSGAVINEIDRRARQSGSGVRMDAAQPGFLGVDALAGAAAIRVTRPEAKALVGRGEFAGEEVVLAKPQTMMNLSGVAVRMLLEKYELEPAQMIVLVDDVDLPWGIFADSRTRQRRNAQRAEVDDPLDWHRRIHPHSAGSGAREGVGRTQGLRARPRWAAPSGKSRARWLPKRPKRSR